MSTCSRALAYDPIHTAVVSPPQSLRDESLKDLDRNRSAAYPIVRRLGADPLMPQFTICPARPADREAVVARLVNQADEFGSLTPRHCLGQVVDLWLENEGPGFVMVAKVNEDIVGVAAVATITSVHYAGRVAWLEELYVLRDWRQQGVGTALVNAVLQRAQEFGMVAVGLDVDARNERVNSLYDRLGFSRVPRSTWVKEFGSK